MTFSAASLITLVSLVDRPHHNKVVALVKRAQLFPKIIRPVAATILTCLLLAFFAEMDKRAILLIAVIVGAATFLTTALSGVLLDNVERHSSNIAAVFTVIALFSGLAVSLILKKEIWMILGIAVACSAITWIIVKFVLLLAVAGIAIISELMSAYASPIAVPILAVCTWLNRRTLRRKYKNWVTTRGLPIVEFNREGIACVNHDNERIFVAAPNHRYGGAALAAGIPLFTLSELSNTELVEQRVRQAMRELKDGGAHDTTILPSLDSHQEVTGHPLMEFNPANGLPMVGGIGGIDVAGNVFGSDQQHFDAGIRHDGFNDH